MCSLRAAYICSLWALAGVGKRGDACPEAGARGGRDEGRQVARVHVLAATLAAAAGARAGQHRRLWRTQPFQTCETKCPEKIRRDKERAAVWTTSTRLGSAQTYLGQGVESGRPVRRAGQERAVPGPPRHNGPNEAARECRGAADGRRGLKHAAAARRPDERSEAACAEDQPKPQPLGL